MRTVSFLRVKVYVAGLYVDASALKKLSNTTEWKGFDKGWMMDSKDEHSGEKLVAALLDQGVTCAIRIGACQRKRECRGSHSCSSSRRQSRSGRQTLAI